jgi:hypothetical protein
VVVLNSETVNVNEALFPVRITDRYWTLCHFRLYTISQRVHEIGCVCGSSRSFPVTCMASDIQLLNTGPIPEAGLTQSPLSDSQWVQLLRIGYEAGKALCEQRREQLARQGLEFRIRFTPEAQFNFQAAFLEKLTAVNPTEMRRRGVTHYQKLVWFYMYVVLHGTLQESVREYKWLQSHFIQAYPETRYMLRQVTIPIGVPISVEIRDAIMASLDHEMHMHLVQYRVLDDDTHAQAWDVIKAQLQLQYRVPDYHNSVTVIEASIELFDFMHAHILELTWAEIRENLIPPFNLLVRQGVVRHSLSNNTLPPERVVTLKLQHLLFSQQVPSRWEMASALRDSIAVLDEVGSSL